MPYNTRLVFTAIAKDGTTFTIKIPETRDNLTRDELDAVMDILIKNKIFPPSSGRVVMKHQLYGPG